MQRLLFLFLSFITSTALGQSSVYKISKDGKSIFLGGTVHVLRAQDYPLPKSYQDAYKQSDVLTFETDTKGLSSPEVVEQLMSKGMFQDERTLESVLSKKVYKQLVKECEAYGLPISMMQKMKPSLVVTTLSAMALQKTGMTEQGVDMYFTEKGTNDKKTFEQLESVEYQIDRIVLMGEGNENEFVKYSLKDMNDIEKTMVELIDAWKNGKAEGMNEEIIQMKKDYPAIFQSLLVERNNNWMPKILSYLENGTKAFVLVGSLHLHGEVGLLNLLKSQGYTITQL